MEQYKTLKFSVWQLIEKANEDHRKSYCLWSKSIRGVYAASTETTSTIICYYDEKEVNSPSLKEFIMEDAANYISKNYPHCTIVHVDCLSPTDLIILFKFEKSV